MDFKVLKKEHNKKINKLRKINLEENSKDTIIFNQNEFSICKLKLFSELLINEYHLSKLISNYCFPLKEYQDQFEKNNKKWPIQETDNQKIIDLKNKIKAINKSIDDKSIDAKELKLIYQQRKIIIKELKKYSNIQNLKIKEAIEENKFLINFRTKHIIFVGFNKKTRNEYYFFQETKKEKKFLQIKMLNKEKYSTFINLDKLWHFNFEKVKVIHTLETIKEALSLQREINFEKQWKNQIITKMPDKILKFLCENTRIEIYQEEWKKRKKEA